MALGVAEVGRVRRSEPDFVRLERMVRDALVRDGWMTTADNVIPYRRLGLAINYSHAAIYNVLVKHSRAQREMLIALADHFEESREEWQAAGGFDVEILPHDRGFTTAERTVARWLKGLSEEDREALLRRAAEEQRHQDGDI